LTFLASSLLLELHPDGICLARVARATAICAQT
jgi:hypothetical protein